MGGTSFIGGIMVFMYMLKKRGYYGFSVGILGLSSYVVFYTASFIQRCILHVELSEDQKKVRVQRGILNHKNDWFDIEKFVQVTGKDKLVDKDNFLQFRCVTGEGEETGSEKDLILLVDDKDFEDLSVIRHRDLLIYALSGNVEEVKKYYYEGPTE